MKSLIQKLSLTIIALGTLGLSQRAFSDHITFSTGSGVGSLTGTHGAGDSTLLSATQQSGGVFQAGSGVGNHDVENFIDASARAVQTHIFYNNSVHDEMNPAANVNDDAAIATDKFLFRQGSTPDFSNYSSYSKGINGIIMDFVNLEINPTSDDFAFKVGNSDNPQNWTDGPAPVSVNIRENEGLNGSDRVTIIWADAAIKSQWLEIQLIGGSGAGFLLDDYYYFGNAVGETGDEALAQVNAVDLLRIRSNPIGIFDEGASVENRYDINRDGFVNAQDYLITRSNPTSLLNGSALSLTPMQISE